MKRKTVLQILFLAIILYAGFQLVVQIKGDLDFEKGQAEIEAVKTAGEENTSPQKAEDTFNQLQAVAPNLVAWLSIPGTEIDFPIVQGTDNEFYLNHDYQGRYNPYGAPFLDKDNTPDFQDQNSIVYGHNAPRAKVFGTLNNYLDPNYLATAPTVELLTKDGIKYYDIQCVYVADPYENFRSPFYEGTAWQEFINRWQTRNVLGLPAPSNTAHLLTLQTCTDRDDERLVIHAVARDT